MAMSVKVFDQLTKKDFENGAVLDEIRASLKELERISAYISRKYAKGHIVSMGHANWCGSGHTTETGEGLKCLNCQRIISN